MSGRETISSPGRRTWRPRDRKGPVCGYTLRGKTCDRRGAHYCEPRADRVVFFFAEHLVHTKGRFARQPFVLDAWQEYDIVRPLFGEVVWSVEAGRYIRRFVVAVIILGRKNGKSELVAGMVLYLLVADDEEAAEVYGAAKDTKQAGKVGEVVNRMRQLSRSLNGDRGHDGRLKHNKNSRRIYDEQTASFFEVIPADAEGELGMNPHAAYVDEVLSQADGSLWDTIRTSAGTRDQPLFVIISTETNKPVSFGASVIDEAERVQDDPARNPRMFAYVRKLPADADPWDENNWALPNPALGSFLSIDALRQEALEARNEPEKENTFRQYRCNQRVSQETRWLPLHLWDAAAGMVVEEDLVGRTCFGGLDLASTTDLAAWVLRFPAEDGKPAAILWRFWTPESQLRHLDRHTGGRASQWVRDGQLVATEGDWIDYDGDPATGRSGSGLAIHPRIRADADRFRIVKVGFDSWQATGTAQFMQRLGLEVESVQQGYGMSEALKELMRQVKHDAESTGPALLCHGGNPVARWCADSAEVRRDDADRIKLVKPDRAKSGKRIDGIAALGNALKVEIEWTDDQVDDWDFLAVDA